MISSILLGLTVSILTTIFSFFPHVDVLPTIAGVNLDTIIVGGVGSLKRMGEAFWYIGDVIQGFLYIAGYFVLKATLKFLSGVLSNFGGAALN